jgi:hypothetical protein
MKRTFYLLGLIIVGLLPLNGCCSSGSGNYNHHQEKVSDIKSSANKLKLTCPSGELFRLILGTNQAKLPAQNQKVQKSILFRGNIVVKQSGREVFSSPISSDNDNNFNWLEDHGIKDGYVLHFDKVPKEQYGGEPLDEYITPGQTYDITVTFSQPPPADASLWVSWVTPM